jgi:hypothetical protein
MQAHGEIHVSTTSPVVVPAGAPFDVKCTARLCTGNRREDAKSNARARTHIEVVPVRRDNVVKGVMGQANVRVRVVVGDKADGAVRAQVSLAECVAEQGVAERQGDGG